MRAVIASRVDLLDREGQAQGELQRARRVLAGIRPSPFGRRILRNFLEHLAG
jgi:hypothetical protein